ncbi:MAG: mucoidy inhibitor MuiA family protein, partial [Bacteroidales bacterium]|nr:mucoidy inhibitor MuiA family protein [Bacteroidales bacterium]
THAQPNIIEPAAGLKNVVVYTDRAMIKKEASFPLKKGENLIKISGITPQMIDQSIQASILGKDILITEVKVEETYLGKIQQEQLQKLQSRMDKLDEQIQKGENQIQAIRVSSDFYGKATPFPSNQRVLPADVDAYAKFIEKSLNENNTRITAIHSGLKKLIAEKAAIELELKNQENNKSYTKNILISALSLSDQTKTDLTFSYLTLEAGWYPQYDIRANPENTSIDLGYFAGIWQFTGEDWKNVSVEVSTSRPAVYGNIPELSEWYVDIYSPEIYGKGRSALMQLESFSEEDKSMETKSAAEMNDFFEKTEIQEGSTSFSFLLPGKIDILSDGQPHRFSIATSKAEAKIMYSSTPIYTQAAYLKATLKNPFTFPLLAGTMNVFYDQKLAGSTPILKNILPDDEMNVSLGIDEGIKIERKLQNKYTEYAGVFTRDTKVNYEYKITLTSGKSKPIAIDLIDRIPVSRNEKIKITVDSPKNQEAEISETGIVTWHLNIAPTEKKEIIIKFSVEYPKDINITGLE